MLASFTSSALRRAGLLSMLVVAASAATLAVVHASRADDAGARVARLARDVERADSVRAVKRLQNSYAQYAQAGLWSDMAALFSESADVIYGGDRVQGRAEVAKYFLTKLGAGQEGLPPGALHTKMVVRPIVTLAPDGVTAKGRWTEFSMSGRYGANAEWAGGIHENDYVKEGGVWKIARLHYHVQYGGTYEAGWLALAEDTKVVPYHFTSANVGTPAPPVAGDAYVVPSSDNPQQVAARLATIERRLEGMVEEDKIKNLQNVYGYYLDRKMWDDVADLFTEDGVFAVANVGVYEGAKSIRRGLERDGPAGLKRGQLNDHVMFNVMAEVAPGGTEGRARGLDLILLGDNDRGTASMTVAVFESAFVKVAGVWRIREMRVFPAAKTDYYQGWAKSALVDPPPARAVAPDRQTPAADVPRGGPVVVDFFYAHPVTGKPLTYPQGTQVVGKVSAFRARPATAASGDLTTRLDAAERQLRVASAYDGVENISGAFGDWLDDFKWNDFSALFAEKGRRRKYQIGFYAGPERILKAETSMYGPTRSPRQGVAIHYRMQPVIDVAPDGRSAKLRTRLFHISISRTRPGVIKSGMYPNDAAVLENGAWKFMNVSIDESYFESASYQDGWARFKEAPAAAPPPPGTPPPPPSRMAQLASSFPPDTPLSAMPNRQQGFIPGAIIRWPDIVPMWFHYVNPVSGRVPEFYCADEFTCEDELARRKRQ